MSMIFDKISFKRAKNKFERDENKADVKIVYAQVEIGYIVDGDNDFHINPSIFVGENMKSLAPLIKEVKKQAQL